MQTVPHVGGSHDTHFAKVTHFEWAATLGSPLGLPDLRFADSSTLGRQPRGSFCDNCTLRLGRHPKVLIRTPRPSVGRQFHTLASITRLMLRQLCSPKQWHFAMVCRLKSVATFFFLFFFCCTQPHRADLQVHGPGRGAISLD